MGLSLKLCPVGPYTRVPWRLLQTLLQRSIMTALENSKRPDYVWNLYRAGIERRLPLSFWIRQRRRYPGNDSERRQWLVTVAFRCPTWTLRKYQKRSASGTNMPGRFTSRFRMLNCWENVRDKVPTGYDLLPERYACRHRPSTVFTRKNVHR